MIPIVRGFRTMRALVLVLGQATLGMAQGPQLPRKPLKYEAECRQVAGDRWLDRWAQLKVESGLNPMAVSPAGAIGIAQFMRRSWQRAIAAGWAPVGSSPFEVMPSIQANHGYMTWLERFFRGDRRKARAGYNAGEGTIRRCERQAHDLGLQGPDAWERVLPSITGHHSKETLAYNPRIEREIRLHGGTP